MFLEKYSRSNQLEKMLRDMYAHNQMTEELIKQRIVEQVDPEHFRSITNSTLEGLAKRELNLSAIVGKSAEAKERRLVPEVIEDFFLQAAPVTGVEVSEQGKGQHTYRVLRVPRHLWPIGERLEPRFGKLGREYKQVVFDKEILKKLPTYDWVTPGHPLFEVVREDLLENVRAEMEKGAVFFDVHRSLPAAHRLFRRDPGWPGACAPPPPVHRPGRNRRNPHGASAHATAGFGVGTHRDARSGARPGKTRPPSNISSCRRSNTQL